MDTRTAQALIRFGLGRRGSMPLPEDPVAWLNSQLDGPDPGMDIACHSGAEGLEALRDDRADQRARKACDDAAEMPHRARDLFRADALAYRDHVLTTDAAFRERLVVFWANHFTVS